MIQEIKAIQKDEYLRNRFIEKYKPFIAKYTSSLTHHYVHYGIDEELSIALIAFNESIDRYNGTGHFFDYSKTIIKSRILDYYKSKDYQEKHLHDSFEDNEIYHTNILSQSYYEKTLKEQELKEEVEELTKLLSYYQITLKDLYDYRPKHLLSKHHIDHLISLMIQDEDIINTIIEKGILPISKIIENYPTTRKKIEPYRKYIISIILIYMGQFELIREYLPRKVMEYEKRNNR